MNDCFTVIVKHYVSRYTNDEVAKDINKFMQLNKFMNTVIDKCCELHDLMTEMVRDHIALYPSDIMNSAKLVRTYARTLLTNIRNYFIHNVV